MLMSTVISFQIKERKTWCQALETRVQAGRLCSVTFVATCERISGNSRGCVESMD